MLSPVRYGQRQFRAGGTSGSIFSLIAATLGSGTISFGYAVMHNGYIWGPILIVLGAMVSYYTGMLIVKCAERTGRTRYEDIALALYGKKVARMTSIFNLVCLMCFTFSYITFVRGAIPHILLLYIDKEKLGWLAPDTDGISAGGVFYGCIFSFCVMFPMSLTRSASALRFTSLFGVMCSMYLSLAVFVVFFSDKTVVPDPGHNLKDMQPFVFSFEGLVTTTPLIIFAYMYQVNIPMIYVELERRNSKTMSKVISVGSGVAVLFYILVGVFGYATFVDHPE